MKKLLSVALAVIMLATMAFSASAATYKDKGSLLPDSADKFVCKAAGNKGTEKITVTKDGDGYKFVGEEGGWPTAQFAELDGEKQTSWIQTKKDSGLFLNYDFTVVSGKTKIVVYFCGQNPDDMANAGTFFCVNAYEMPDKKKIDGDCDEDLGTGTYKKSVPLSELGYREDLYGEAGEMLITGFKVFAVGGEVVVRDLSIGEKYADGQDAPTQGATTTTAANTGANSTEATTTAAQAQNNTTTVAKTTAANNGDSAKTGDVSNAIVFVVVAAVAAGVVTLSVVSSKKSKAR